MIDAKPIPTVQSRRKRRWFGYSLRTLLIAVTLLAVWLGWQVRAARVQRDAVARLKTCYASVYYAFEKPTIDLTEVPIRLEDMRLVRGPRLLTTPAPPPPPEPPGPKWLTEFLGVDFLNTVVAAQVVFSTTRDSSHALDDLGYLPSLQTAVLYALCVQDDDLATLSHLSRLEHLSLADNGLKGPGLRHLASLGQLSYLDLSTNRITDDGLKSLPLLPNLTRLNLRNTAITDASLDHLAKLPSLQTVDLSETPITAAAVKRLQQARPGLMVKWDSERP